MGHLTRMCSATNMYLTGFVLIALYISVPVLCDGETENRTTTILPNYEACTEAQKSQNVLTANKAVKSFRHLVKTYLEKKPIDADMSRLKLRLDNYTLAIASCAPKPRVDKLKKTIKDFLELIKFTFEGNKLKEFAKHEGALHVNNTRNSIRQCVIKNTGLWENRTSYYFKFVDLVNVELGEQSACDEANTTLSCVALRLEEANGKVDETQNLAKSLFDFVAEKHCVPEVIPTAAPTISAATNISLLVIFAAVAVGSCIVTIILWKKNKSNSYAP